MPLLEQVTIHATVYRVVKDDVTVSNQIHLNICDLLALYKIPSTIYAKLDRDT